MINISYTLSKKEYKEALLQYRIKNARKISRILRIFYLIAASVCLLILLIMVVFSIIRSEYSGFPALLLIIILLILPFLPRRVWIRVPQSYDEHRWYEVSFSDGKISAHATYGDSTTDWTVYERFSESAEFFFLKRSGSYIFEPFPKTAFTVEQADEFRAMAARNIPKGK